MEYRVVDVFTSEIFQGNPVAVILDAANLDTATMQSIARWTNLSETTFVVPKTNPDADYHVRIFTPDDELPFAGHPSLGTAYALLEAGIIERKKSLIQECSWGKIEINVDENELEFGLDGMSLDTIPLEDVEDSLPGLQIVTVAKVVNCGPRWVVVKVYGNEKELISYFPNFAKIATFSKTHNVTGICVFSEHSSDPYKNIEIRTFAPVINVNEDPVCGSGNAAVAYYRNIQKPYISFQGSALSRNGQIKSDYRDGKIFVQGKCVVGIEGNLRDLDI